MQTIVPCSALMGEMANVFIGVYTEKIISRIFIYTDLKKRTYNRQFTRNLSITTPQTQQDCLSGRKKSRFENVFFHFQQK